MPFAWEDVKSPERGGPSAVTADVPCQSRADPRAVTNPDGLPFRRQRVIQKLPVYPIHPYIQNAMHQSTADGLNNMTRHLDAPAKSTMGLMESATSSGPVAEGSGESDAKRRKLRKGTRSCWECKRRKIRCVFDNAAEDAVCLSCQRRGTACVSQEYPEEEQSGGRARRMGDRIVRVESLVEQLVQTVGGYPATGSSGVGERGPSLGVLTPDDSGSESARLFGIYSTSVVCETP